MALNITKPEEHRGSLIALEGDPDTVAIQLQLLPLSSRILILPPLEIAPFREGIKFNARFFVRSVHEQLQNQFKIARSFLESSTSEQPRLVFMSGGSINAVVKCVTAISENITNGEIGEAEDLFHEIVKDGVAGLLRQDDTQIDEGSVQPGVAEDGNDRVILQDQEAETYQLADHPSISAMKAADSLDRDTAALQQPAEGELEDTEIIDIWHNAARSTTGSVPNTPRIMDILSTNEEGNSIKTTVIEVPYSCISPVEGRFVFSPPPYTPRTAHSVFTDGTSHDGSMDNFYLRSPSLCKEVSAPPTPGLVELGEACIVEVSANGARAVKRVKSIEYSSSSTLRSPFLGLNHHNLKRTTSVNGLRYSGSKIQKYMHARSQDFLAPENVPRPMFVKASETVITRSPSTFRYPYAPHTYIDRGTDTHGLYESETVADEPEEDIKNSGPFESVFPVDEDLIVHFSNGRNGVFESIIRSYKNGCYPVASRMSHNSKGFKSLSSSSQLEDKITEMPVSPIATNVDSNPCYPRRNVKLNSRKNLPLDGRCAWPVGGNPKDSSHIMPKAEPPTPATTPPLVKPDVTQKFQEIIILSDAIMAIDVQNSLRLALSIRLPPEASKVKQHIFAIESNRLWKPLFHNCANSCHSSTTVDQIIAIGCEDGVTKGFFHSILAKVENLGSKKHSPSRASKLDIRYIGVLTPIRKTF
jgi:hypothetical protein